DALYLSRDGVVWLRVDVPASTAPASPPAAGQHTGHQHGPAGPPNPITTVAVGNTQMFAGTAQGLFASGFDGPMRQVAFPGGGGRGLAMDPANANILWATSSTGPMLSTDAGLTWARQAAGLGRPGDASAIAYLGRDVFVSDSTGIFERRPGSV